jgi:acetyl-CoA carboxylase carboxyl transferase subunit alpha
MQVTAQDLKAAEGDRSHRAESMGGAHRDPAQTVAALGKAISEELDSLAKRDSATLRKERADKFLAMGQ